MSPDFVHAHMLWLVPILDIKDAFLLVPQQERILVSMPPWWKPETHAEGADRF